MNKAKQYERWAAYGFGIVFLLILFVVVLFRPNPTAFQYLVFRVLLALAAAGIAAFIPGFLEVALSPVQTIAIRAGGAIAVFFSSATLSFSFSHEPLNVINHTFEPELGYGHFHKNMPAIFTAYSTIKANPISKVIKFASSM